MLRVDNRLHVVSCQRMHCGGLGARRDADHGQNRQLRCVGKPPDNHGISAYLVLLFDGESGEGLLEVWRNVSSYNERRPQPGAVSFLFA